MNAISPATYRRRREQLRRVMGEGRGDAVAVFPAAPIVTRDTHTPLYGYRQDLDLHYLTGFPEPRSVAVLTKDKLALFVQPRKRDREMWEGPCVGLEGAKERYGADEVYSIDDLDAQLPKLIANHKRLFYRMGKDAAFDQKIFGILNAGRSARRVATTWPTEIVDGAAVVHELRMFKDEEELALIRQCASIAAEAHLRVIPAVKPGMFEHEIEAILYETIRRRGGRPAYGICVPSGPNTTTVQYWNNDREMQAGELVFVDAGCRYGEMSCDMTRCLPVSGTFTREQRAIYDVVLDAHLAGFAAARPGSTIEAVQQAHQLVITEGLVRLGLLTGDPKELVATGAHKTFYWHRTNHWLGMDPADVGVYYDEQGNHRPLVPGMCMSVEPAVYIDKDREDVAPEWRGICVRIEDNVLVGDDGPVILTDGVPRTAPDIERLRQGK